MKFSDLFVPRWQHSNPQVRIKAIQKVTDPKLLKEICEKDQDVEVRQFAENRLAELEGPSVYVKE